MERTCAIGISWRHGEVGRLAPYTLPEEGRVESVRALARALDVRELVYVATCNRVEVLFGRAADVPPAAYRARVFEALRGRAPTPGETERTFRVWSGEGAVEHLFLVTAGLDSAQVGETEIAGQVRRALDLSRELDLVGPRLGPLCEEALKIARRVHKRTGVGVGHTSLAELALERVRARLARTPGAVALVGVSPMTERCSCELVTDGRPVLVVNRTLAKAERLAAELGSGTRAVSLDAFRAEPEPVEALLLATAAAEPVLGRADLERLAAHAPSGEGPLVVDLSIPPDVDPNDARAVLLERVGMDELVDEARRTRDRRVEESSDARVLVDEALERWRRSVGERALSPMLAALQRHYRGTAVHGIERLFKKELAGLDEPQRDAVRRWAETLARRFAHMPTTGLQELAAELGPGALECFFRRADAGLARELAEAADALDDLPGAAS